MRPLLRPFVAVASVTLTVGLAAAPASAVPTTTLDPAKLPRGADVAIPHLDKKTIVDGSVRIRVKAPRVTLLGKSGTGYVVGTSDRDGSHGRIHRYEADGSSTQLVRAQSYASVLSGDGQTLLSVKGRSKSVVSARSATTGALVAQRTFKGYVDVVDAEGSRVLLSSWEEGTQQWDTGSDAVTPVSKRVAGSGDLSADVFSSYSKDPYEGGCTIVSPISRPAKRLWTSCKERVEAFSADGARMATVDILSDGLGPTYVAARKVTGKKLGAYLVRDGWFGAIRFETSTALLLDTFGLDESATVRCTGSDCERASDLRPTQTPRIS